MTQEIKKIQSNLVLDLKEDPKTSGARTSKLNANIFIAFEYALEQFSNLPKTKI